MRKTLTGLVAFLLIGIAAKAQSEKEIKPPPPPPKTIIVEKVEVKEPPVTAINGNRIDEKIKVKEPPVITVKGKMANDFYKRNPSVAAISRQGNIITLKKQNGTIEKYNMAKKEEDRSFTEKYGESPIPPPPPPPKKEEQ